MTTPDKLAAFFALLDKRQQAEEVRKAQERKDEQDKRLAKIRPWWTLASQ